jgi:4-hydroxybenzoate polyprenyltransferase
MSVSAVAIAAQWERKLPPLVRAMRPRQFIKNAIVITPLVFSVGLAWHLSQPSTWMPLAIKVTVAFAAFCCVAAAEYLVNDVLDVESDRLHPRKRLRPIAAGELTPRTAQGTAALLFCAGLALGGALGWRVLGIVAAYTLLMLGYSYVLKELVIVDVLTVALGFVLRAMAGAVAIDVKISPWLYLCTILGALFLAVNKRRHELLILGEGAVDHRRILSEYSTQLLDQMSATVTACTVLAYSLYTFTADNLPANHVMMATIPFVIYGIFRYLYLVYRRDEGGSPDELVVRDKPLLACMALFLMTAMALLAIFRG